MSCTNCQSLEIKIDLPSDLKRAIRIAKGAVTDGRFEYLGIDQCGDSFILLSRANQWGDFIHNYFRCSECNQLFKLWAETYHGSGGGLKPVDVAEGEITQDQNKN